MKNYQQTVKQRRVKLDKLKQAYAKSKRKPIKEYSNATLRRWD